jgi:hypothetical protein
MLSTPRQRTSAAKGGSVQQRDKEARRTSGPYPWRSMSKYEEYKFINEEIH